QSCGATIELKPVASKARPAVAAPVPVPAAIAVAAPSEVCCPRCNFHFVPAASAEPKRSGRQTLLVVEDMDYFIEIARDALGSRYELKVAKTLDEARKILV